MFVSTGARRGNQEHSFERYIRCNRPESGDLVQAYAQTTASSRCSEHTEYLRPPLWIVSLNMKGLNFAVFIYYNRLVIHGYNCKHYTEDLATGS